MSVPRVIASAGVFALLAGWLLVGVPSAAFADVTDGDYTFTANAANVVAGAELTGYTGSLTSIAIPDTVTDGTHVWNVTSIGDDAFLNTGLTAVTIPPTVTTIGDAAFQNNFFDSIVLPAGLTHLGVGAFDQNDLESVTLPAGITTIPDYAFDNSNLFSVTLAPGTTSIGIAAFGEANLTSFTITDKVTTIGDNAFQDDALDSLVIPASVKSIGQTINTNLTTVSFQGAAPSTFTAAGATGSFGVGTGLTVSYSSACGDPPRAGGFTTPTWKGYATAAVAGPATCPTSSTTLTSTPHPVLAHTGLSLNPALISAAIGMLAVGFVALLLASLGRRRRTR